MFDASLSDAVRGFGAAVHDVSNAALDLPLPWRGVDSDLRWQLFHPYEELRALAAKLFATRMREGRPLSEAQVLLAHYHIAFRQLEGLLQGISDAELDRAPSEGEWPLRQVLSHVEQTERAFYALSAFAVSRWRQGERDAQAMPRGQMDEREGVAGGDGSFAEVFSRMTALHERVLRSFVDLTAEELEAPLVFWYTADLRFQLRRFDAHLREHAIQTAKVLEALRPPASDAQRTLWLTYDALGEAEAATLGTDGVEQEARTALAARIVALGPRIRGAAMVSPSGGGSRHDQERQAPPQVTKCK